MLRSRSLFRLAAASFSSSSSAPVGFIGLGNMGGHMAHNLLKGGHSLIVYDLNAKALDTVASQAKALNRTAHAAKSPAEVAKNCSTVITMLPSSPHVRDVLKESKTSVFSAIQKGSIIIDSSTIDPGTTRALAADAKSLGISMIDAPVSGGVGGAEAGTLTFMVGGSVEEFERAKTYLSKMGKNLVHCGDIGTGQIAKICNNLVLAICMAGVSEAMNLGIKSGIDAKKLAGIFNSSTARCWSSEVYNPVPGIMANVPSSRGYTGGFGTALMRKDLSLAELAAQQASVPSPLGDTVKRLYDEIITNGNGGKDFSFIYEHLKNRKA